MCSNADRQNNYQKDAGPDFTDGETVNSLLRGYDTKADTFKFLEYLEECFIEGFTKEDLHHRSGECI